MALLNSGRGFSTQDNGGTKAAVVDADVLSSSAVNVVDAAGVSRGMGAFQIKSASYEVTLPTGAAYVDVTAANLGIPSDAIVLAVTGKATVAATVAATGNLGVSGTTDKYNTTNAIDLSKAGNTAVSKNTAPAAFAAIRVTVNTAETSGVGKVLVTCFYSQVVAPGTGN